MKAKVVREAYGLAIVLPPDAIEALQLQEGSEVSIAVDSERQRVVMAVNDDFEAIDESFARQVAEFIEQYRPSLEALAK